MLAFMPQSPPLSDFYTPTMGTSTMSLALLPSLPMTYGEQVVPTLLPPGPSPSKRPKLTLNTSSVNPVYGKGSTSLRLETLSATSPTARNTFRNAQNRDRIPGAKPTKPALTPLATNIASTSPSTSIPTPSNIPLPDSADNADPPSSSAASATSVSTIDSLSSEIPYKLPFNATSILTNGPIPRSQSRRISFAQSRPMFPAAKRVTFRAPLTEDIKTTKFTLRHSDIESSASTISPLKLSVPKENSPVQTSSDQSETRGPNADAKVTTSPLAGSKRESEDEEDDSDSVPMTPIAGRRKRHRQWVWTLGPISQAEESPDAADEEANTRSS